VLCGLGFVAAGVTAYLDERGMAQLGRTASTEADARRVNIKDIFKFSMSYWLVTLSIMFFYNGVFPFVADASYVTTIAFLRLMLILYYEFFQ
jgi:hypothetical protein